MRGYNFVTLEIIRIFDRLGVLNSNTFKIRKMSSFEIIKCHGSGNDFVMVDATSSESLRGINRELFARLACNREDSIGGDGVLFVDRFEDGVYGMDMLNPDGTHAEMCGNGIRCVARLAAERGYLRSGVLRSGSRDYRVAQAGALAEGIECFSVDIALHRHSPDFAFFAEGESFLGRVIEELDTELRFTALSPGNPHIVAAVDSIDLTLLERLGERVKSLKTLFPRGVNISLYERRASDEIFVATYERGAGITLSCGTAMTSSATAAVMLGMCDAGRRIEVRNRGGKVFCTTNLTETGEPITRLEGNATFEWWGRAEMNGGELCYDIERVTGEAELWRVFVQSLKD